MTEPLRYNTEVILQPSGLKARVLHLGEDHLGRSFAQVRLPSGRQNTILTSHLEWEGQNESC